MYNPHCYYPPNVDEVFGPAPTQMSELVRCYLVLLFTELARRPPRWDLTVTDSPEGPGFSRVRGTALGCGTVDFGFQTGEVVSAESPGRTWASSGAPVVRTVIEESRAREWLTTQRRFLLSDFLIDELYARAREKLRIEARAAGHAVQDFIGYAV
jgi:hypothetical protein